MLLSFTDVWKYLNIGGDLYSWGWALGVTGLLAAAAAIGSGRHFKTPALRWHIVLGAAPVVFVVARLVQAAPVVSALLINLYALALAGTLVMRGLRTERAGSLNLGLLLFSSLVVCRFFDSDLDFIVRALAFMLLGALMLASNLYLARRKRPKMPSPQAS